MKKNFNPDKYYDKNRDKSKNSSTGNKKKEVWVKTSPVGKSKEEVKGEKVKILRPRISKSQQEKPKLSSWKGGFKKDFDRNDDKNAEKKPFKKDSALYAKGKRTFQVDKTNAKKYGKEVIDKKNSGQSKYSAENKYKTEKKYSTDKKYSADKRGVKSKYAKGPEKIQGAEKNYKGNFRKKEKETANLLNASTLLNESVRINRYIANSGICSRREADVLITQGLVFINGKVVTDLGVKVNPGDEVKVDGRRITPEKPVYLLMNKPKGFITTTSDPEGRPTVLDLIDMPGKERIFPIGRLDRHTTGVLLLTNDGELAQVLTHPSFEIKKVYRAKLDKKPGKEHMLAWVNGVELEDGFMSFEQIGFVDDEDDAILGLEIHSGRNRIVRRMFEHFGYEVKSLDRVLLGEFDKLKLGRGKWRFLNEKEIKYVERLKRKPKTSKR